MTVGSTGPGSRSATFSRPRVSSQRAAIRAPISSISGRSGPSRVPGGGTGTGAGRRPAKTSAGVGTDRSASCASAVPPAAPPAAAAVPAAATASTAYAAPDRTGSAAAAAATGGSTSDSRYGRQKAASSCSTVSASHTSRSAWLTPYGGSTPQTCTRTP